MVVFFGLLAGKGLMGPGYFNMHDDLQMMRQLEMEKCFSDGQIPCRWVQDMGYGFGFPLFNFYPPLPYLIGQGIRVLGFSFVDTVKMVFILAFVASGVTMYFLAREFFGRLGGVLASIFYVWAPYHAVDVYVRGAMNEAWALVWFPLILLCGYKIIKNEKKVSNWVVGMALATFALLTSHNLMVLIFAPVAGIWCLGWVVKEKKWRRLPHLILSGIWALGLAAFFTLPVAFESKLVHSDSLVKGYYEYVAHFATLKQLFVSRFWGYGPSVWLEGDGMSFQVGHLHWGLTLVIGFWLLVEFLKKRKLDGRLLPVVYFLGVGWFATYMIHLRSLIVWRAIPALAYVQFPWRFLAIVILAFSFAVGGLIHLIPKKFLKWGVALLVGGILVLNWNYFRPQNGRLGALTDEEKFSGAAWDLQQTAGIYDYLPKAAKTAPKEPQGRGGLTEVMRGQAVVTNPMQDSKSAQFEIKVEDEKAVVRVGIFKLEGWKAYLDGVEIPTFVGEEDEWGRMWIEVPRGEHVVIFKLTDTPVRRTGNLISLAAWGLFLGYLLWRKRGSGKQR